MAGLNHWIPACACLLQAGEGWNPGRRAGGVKGWQGLSDGAFDCCACGCHSRSAGMACFNHWIPAFAGMTVGGCGQALGKNSKGVVGMATNPFPPPASFRRRPESRKAGRGVKGWQGLSDGAFGCRCCGCHSRYAGMACFNHPACSRQVDSSFRWNDGRAAVRNSAGMAKGLSGWQQTHSHPRRHSGLPAAGRRRPESRRAGQGVKGWQGLPDGAFGCHYCSCHSRYAGMTCFNHPACSTQVDSGLR